MRSVLLIAIVFLIASFSYAEDCQNIIKQADEIRNPSDSYQMSVEIENVGDHNKSLFDVLLNGKDKTLVRTLKPLRDKGRNLLMLKEEMWAYVPNLKRAVRVSLSQKLTGQAANGDISRMRWSDDYSPEFEKQDAKQWTIFLKSKKRGLTYDKIRVWIEKGTFRPLKAEYLTVSGKVMKKAEYGNFRQIAGKVRPTQITIQDAIRESDKSVIRIQEMKVRAFPSALFEQNNLGETE